MKTTEQYTNFGASILNATIDNSTDPIDIVVLNGAEFPPEGPFRVTVTDPDGTNGEIFLSTADRTGNTIQDCIRAQEGTIKRTHATGSLVFAAPTRDQLQLLKDGTELGAQNASQKGLIRVQEPPPITHASPTTGDDSFAGRWDAKKRTIDAVMAIGGRIELTGETFLPTARQVPAQAHTHIKGVPGQTKLALPSGSVFGMFDASNKHIIFEDIILDGSLSGGATEPNPGATDILYPLVYGGSSGGGTTRIEFRGRCHLIQGTVPDAPGTGAQKGRKGVHIEAALITTTYLHGSITAATRTLTVTDGAFTQANVGDRIAITAAGYNSIDIGAGGLGAPEVWFSWIIAVTDATHVVIFDTVPTTASDKQVQVFSADGLAVLTWDDLEVEGGYRGVRALRDVESGGRKLKIHDVWDYGFVFEQGDRKQMGHIQTYRTGQGGSTAGSVYGGGGAFIREHRYSFDQWLAWDTQGWGAVFSVLTRNYNGDIIEADHCGLGASGYGGVTFDTAQAATGVGGTVEGTLWPSKGRIGRLIADGNPNGAGVNFADVQDLEIDSLHTNGNGGSGATVNSADIQIATHHSDYNARYPIEYSAPNPDTWSPKRGRNQSGLLSAKGNTLGDEPSISDGQQDTAMTITSMGLIQAFPLVFPLTGSLTTWTNQPAALTEFAGVNRFHQARDMRGYRRARLYVKTGTTAGAAAKAGTVGTTAGAVAIVGASGPAWVAADVGREIVVVGAGKQGTGSMANNSTTLQATAGTFHGSDVGKAITVPGAGAGGAALNTTIAIFTDSTHVILADANASGGAVAGSAFVITGDLWTTIATFTDGTHITLTDKAGATVAGATTTVRPATLVMQMSSDGGTTWQFLDNITGPSIDISTANGDLVSLWVNISFAAKKDGILRLAGINGTGAISPTFGSISVELQQ